MSFSSNNPLQTNQLPRTINMPELTEESFRQTLTDYLQKISNTTNTKENSLYLLQETANFKQLYTANDPMQNRNSYRKVFDMIVLNGGNIGAGAPVSFPHGITGLFNTMMIYASCKSTEPRYFSVMNSTVYLDATKVYFTNPLGVALTQCFVNAEYLKN